MVLSTLICQARRQNTPKTKIAHRRQSVYLTAKPIFVCFHLLVTGTYPPFALSIHYKENNTITTISLNNHNLSASTNQRLVPAAPFRPAFASAARRPPRAPVLRALPRGAS